MLKSSLYQEKKLDGVPCQRSCSSTLAQQSREQRCLLALDAPFAVRGAHAAQPAELAGDGDARLNGAARHAEPLACVVRDRGEAQSRPVAVAAHLEEKRCQLA